MEHTKQVLDYGYVTKIDHWGSDEQIVEAARMSTNKGFKGWGPKDCDCVGTDISDGMAARDWSADCKKCKGTGGVPGDEKLLRYLWTNKHATPFEMAGLTIEVQAPIFVFRQWHRHRTQSYNEMSARYTPLPAVDYLPSVERLMPKETGNKQAGTVDGSREATRRAAENFREALKGQYKRAEDLYQQALSDGLPKELARVHLPVARYSRMRASANLRNWLGFLSLRLDPHAQYEIRVYAEAVGEFIERAFPRTWELFAEGHLRDA